MKILEEKGKLFLALDRDVQIALESFMGKKEKSKVMLNWIEALYLKEMKNAEILSSAEKLAGKKNINIYLCYRDLRSRGLFPLFSEIKNEKKEEKIYKEGNKPEIRCKIDGYFLSPDNYAVIPKRFSELYFKNWFGQLGMYKNENAGELFVLDRFEAIYLHELGILNISQNDKKQLEKIKNFNDYYEVYKNWRNNGFVVKTGFKFGSDFRIYYPGTNPKNFEHSKHVLHVFPKGFNMKVEELSRAIRVANSVKKTFILAVPEETKKAKIDFFLLGREKQPLACIKTLSQEQNIKSNELSSLLKKAEEQNLPLIFGIADRESSLTYYEVSRIKIGSSKFNYYEVKWTNP